jgi:hypothetical protein
MKAVAQSTCVITYNTLNPGLVDDNLINRACKLTVSASYELPNIVSCINEAKKHDFWPTNQSTLYFSSHTVSNIVRIKTYCTT